MHANNGTREKPGRALSFLNRPLIQKVLFPSVLRFLRRYRPRLAPRVILMTPNHILKYGSAEIYSEACAIDFVSKNTTIPVPNILQTIQARNGITYIIMTRCPGEPLQNVIRELSQAEKESVLAELKGYIDQLRAIKPPQPKRVESIKYGPLIEERISDKPCGPFENIGVFHRAMRLNAEIPSGHEECDKMIAAQDRREYDIRSTHGDLSLRHVYYLDGKITGIIDWESVGWLPEYWEYTMAWDAFWDSPDLRDDITAVLEPYPEEVEMEKARIRLFCGRG